MAPSYWHGRNARMVDVDNIQFPAGPPARAVGDAEGPRRRVSFGYESQADATLVPPRESLY
jgi:hypothetical protein